MEIIKNIYKKIYWWKICKKKGCNIGRKSNISVKSILGGRNKIGNRSKIGNSMIGYATYIGSDSEFQNARIGKYSSIGNRVKQIVGFHPSYNWVSTHPAFFSLLKQSGFTYVKNQKFIENRFIDKDLNIMLEIGNDVWIGDDVKILSGVKIKDGAIIATGAVVTKDVEEYCIYGGVPAKKIRDRFNEEEKEFLIKLKWWNKEEAWIKEKSELFEDIKIFIDRIE